jgi:Ca2+-binding EF-hand superfamily protein
LRDYPNGRLNREQFRHFHQRCFPYGDPGQFAEYFFSVFDTDQNGEISFKEFICPLSLTLRGDPGEKLECTFPSFPPILPVVRLEGKLPSDASALSLILMHLWSP